MGPTSENVGYVPEDDVGVLNLMALQWVRRPRTSVMLQIVVLSRQRSSLQWVRRPRTSVMKRPSLDKSNGLIPSMGPTSENVGYVGAYSPVVICASAFNGSDVRERRLCTCPTVSMTSGVGPSMGPTSE